MQELEDFRDWLTLPPDVVSTRFSSRQHRRFTLLVVAVFFGLLSLSLLLMSLIATV